ncbi:MAG: RluA family pseudouridine synthase [Bdellovibrionia bacterium]
MPLKKITIKTTALHHNQRLDHMLSTALPSLLNQAISKGKVRKLIVAGAVYLNGKRVRIASKELLSNARIEVYIDFDKLNSDSASKDVAFIMKEDRVLFEDEYIIVINKPPGLPTQPTLDEARDNLFAAVKKFLHARVGKSSPPPYLGLHHRLDRDTSGVILFTKSTQANAGVAEIFAGHLAQKTYQALVSVAGSGGLTGQKLPIPQESWTIKNYLGRPKGSPQKGKFGSVRSGGDFAHTDFRLLERLSGGFWVEAQPLTGRTHQIRIHLSENGMPILGDSTYGGLDHIGKLSIPRLMLHAVDLTFPHPIHENKVSVQSPLPEDFSRCLKALQKGFPNTFPNS